MFAIVDKQGRASIPANYRKRLGIKTGDSVMVTLTETGIMIEPDPLTPKCAVCETEGSTLNPIHEINGYPSKHMCRECTRLFRSTNHIKI